MDRHQFNNLLRVLISIDRHEVPFLTDVQYEVFGADPYRFFIRCSDEACDKLWSVMQGRAARRAA